MSCDGCVCQMFEPEQSAFGLVSILLIMLYIDFCLLAKGKAFQERRG